jgi:ketosteroid isomerase-like protein
VSGGTTQPSYADDRAQIEDLMARYLFAMDWNDFDTYAECFTEDGVLDYAMGTTSGRENIRAEARRFKENVGTLYVDSEGRPAKLRHVVAHKAIRVEGDRAWNTGFWFEMANDGPDGALKMGTFGHYEDELARIGGEWKFKRRKIYNEFLEGRTSTDVNPVGLMDDAAGAAGQRWEQDI